MSNNPIPGRPVITRHYFPHIAHLSNDYILGLYAKVDDSMDRVWGEKHERETYKFLGIYSCDTEEIKPFPATEDWEEGIDPKKVWWYPNRWPVNPDFTAKILMWLFLNIWLGIILRPMFWYKILSRVIREYCISFYVGMSKLFLRVSTQTKSVKQRPRPIVGSNLKISGKISMFDIPDNIISILKYAVIAAALVVVANNFYDRYQAKKELERQGAVATLERANENLQIALDQQKKEMASDQAIWLEALEEKTLAAHTANDLKQRKEELLREMEAKFDKAIAEQEAKEAEEQAKQQLEEDERRMAAIRAEIKDIQNNSDLGTVLGVSNKPVDYSLAKESQVATLKTESSLNIKSTVTSTKIAKASTVTNTKKTTTTTKTNTSSTTSKTKTAAELKRDKEIAVSQIQIDYLWDVYKQATSTS